jgi:superfamily II DNA or RNA helicase
MELLDYQQKALNFIIDKDEALCALEMGLGKTFTAVKWLELKPVLNTIILCQSNKINDWYEEAVDVLGGKYNIIKIKSLKQLQELPINSG